MGKVETVGMRNYRRKKKEARTSSYYRILMKNFKLFLVIELFATATTI